MNSPIIKKSKTTKVIKKKKNKITFDLGRGLKKEKSSYSNIFKEKLKYVSTDIGLSQNKSGSYSNFYKDGIKLNTEDFDNKSNTSLINSMIMSERNMTAGNSPNKNYIYSPLKTSPFKKKKNHIVFSPFKNGKRKNNDSSLIKNDNSEEYFKSFNSRKKSYNDEENNSKNNDDKDNNKNNLEIKNNRNDNKDKNSFRKSNKNKKNVKSPLKKINKKIINDDILKCNNVLINNDIKEVDEEDEKDNQFGIKLYNLINVDEDNSKKNSEKKLNDILNNNKLNNKKKNCILFGKNGVLLKNNNSYEEYNKKNKYFDLNNSEIEKYFKKSKSSNFTYKYKDFETIKQLLGYDKNINNLNKNALNNNLLSNLKNSNENEKTKIKTIFSKAKNINNINNVIKNSINNNSNFEEQNNFNESNSNKNTLESQKRNSQSYILRKGKKIIKSENSSINVDSENFDNNNNQLKKSIEETNEEINNLIKKIRESSKDKNDILINYKEQHKKELEKLMKEKSDLKMKKFKLFQEKAHKNQKIKQKNENESFRKNWKKILINLPIQNTIQTTNQKEKKQNNFKLLKARSDLSILSEPFNTNKEFNFNKNSEKKFFSFRKISDNKKDSKNLDSNNKSSSLNSDNDKLGKNESLIIHSYYNKNNSAEKNTYLEIVKEDVKNLKLNKLTNNFSYKPRRKINSKNYIMPVNNLNDVIQIKDAYYNLNVNKNINKKK